MCTCNLQAKLLDKATGAHVRFRLGGVSTEFEYIHVTIHIVIM